MSHRRPYGNALPAKVLEYSAALFPKGARVLCAVSGGADSLALLYVLLELEPFLDITVAAVAHCNHGLRGASSDGDENFVRELCEKLTIEFVSERADVRSYAAENSLGIEDSARRLRYDFLERARLQTRCDVIAVAHHADDNLETVLLNMTRGAGLAGLCGITASRGAVLRPMLNVTRPEVENYVAERGLRPRFDETNDDTRIRRNLLRKEVCPTLRSLNPSLSRAVTEMCRSLRRDEDCLASLASEALQYAVHDGEQISYDCARLAKLHPAIAVRVLRALAQEAGGVVPTREQTEAMLRLALDGMPSGSLNLSEGLQARRRYGELILGHCTATCDGFKPIALEAGGEYLLGNGKRIVCSMERKKFTNNSVTISIAFGAICGILIARPRAGGDFLSLCAGKTRRIKKMMIDMKIPAADRNNMVILADDKGVVAAEGLGVDRRCAPYPDDKTLHIYIMEAEA